MIYAATGQDEAVMMSINAGRYYGLNAVASRIWELLETPQNVPELCRQILEEFEVDAPTCETEVRRFIGELLDNGIVHESAA
jgi:hypothetical protein